MKIKVSSKDFLSPLNYSVFILDLPLLKYEELKQADVIVMAIGKAKFLKKELPYLK